MPLYLPRLLIVSDTGSKRIQGHRTEQNTHCALVQTACPELNICERVTDVRAGIYNSSNLLPSVLSCRGTRLQLPLNISSADRHSNVQFLKLVLLWRFALSRRKFGNFVFVGIKKNPHISSAMRVGFLRDCGDFQACGRNSGLA